LIVWYCLLFDPLYYDQNDLSNKDVAPKQYNHQKLKQIVNLPYSSRDKQQSRIFHRPNGS